MSERAERQVRTIDVSALARVEGEGGLHVRLRGGHVERVELQIYEPPRFFEAFLRGRSYAEVLDITSRICGICPIAYQTSAANAVEAAFGVDLDEPLRDLRRLIYCGEWIESHALHVLMLHAPDFLGYQGGIEMARDHRPLVEAGLRLKKAGNRLVTVVGGREIHPINLRVGGFHRLPTRAELAPVRELLADGLETSLTLTRWAATFDYPDHERDVELVSLAADRYPIEDGRIVSSGGLDLPAEAYERHFVEEHVPHSTALHSRLIGHGTYLVGPAARFVLNRELLSPAARAVTDEIGLDAAACRNPFRSILVRCVELVHACEEALRLIEGTDLTGRPAVPVEPRAGIGHGCSEAPRGLLYHRYALDDDGIVLDARIVPPTSQNQATIELDLSSFVERHQALPDDELQRRCEQAIRNYDPCISCATHFLTLDLDRG